MKPLKKFGRPLFFLLCLAVFLSLRFLSIYKTQKSEHYAAEKPPLPDPITISSCHPWLFLQPSVESGALEIMRDFERIQTLSKQIPQISEQELTALLMRTLLAVQASLPFNFPNHLYNVLCISPSEGNVPAPYRIVKRVYLGESSFGLPFYLDVRVYDLTHIREEEIVDAHLKTLDGEYCELSSSQEKRFYLCRGKQTQSYHDFSLSDEERGLFLGFSTANNHLYVCVAEAPLSLFAQYKPLFVNLSQTNSN